MKTVTVPELDLMEVFFDSDRERKRVRVSFPINRWAGADGTAVVCFEVEPGGELPTHTDSAEEILYIVAGRAEVTVGGETGAVAAGDLAVVPAMAPHGLVNDGDETLKVIGFFGSAEVHSAFDEPVQPIGAQELTQGRPAPQDAH